MATSFRTSASSGPRPGADNRVSADEILLVDRRRIWEELLVLAKQHNITFDYTDYDLEQIADAWQAQKTGAYAKITSKIKA